MNKDEMKDKYSTFITKVSEIMGLEKPIDIIKLCMTTDLFFKPLEKRIAELEERISVLLSCKNCPENKGGLICQKEYENKCLAQKIQFIKELQEENTELKRDKEDLIFIRNQNAKCMCEDKDQLTKAKEIMKKLLDTAMGWWDRGIVKNEAEQFLEDNEVEK